MKTRHVGWQDSGQYTYMSARVADTTNGTRTSIQDTQDGRTLDSIRKCEQELQTRQAEHVRVYKTSTSHHVLVPGFVCQSTNCL